MFWGERMTFSNLIHQVIAKLLHLAVQYSFVVTATLAALRSG